MTATRATSIKAPPYSVASEKVVLGSILRRPATLVEIRKIIPGGNVFFRPEHGRMFNMIIETCGKQAVETEQLIGLLAASAKGDQASGEPQLRAIASAGGEPSAAVHHARIVAEKARMRRLIDSLTDILNEAYHSEDGFDAILKKSLSRLQELRRLER
jgi:replicative DNA helicase